MTCQAEFWRCEGSWGEPAAAQCTDISLATAARRKVPAAQLVDDATPDAAEVATVMSQMVTTQVLQLPRER